MICKECGLEVPQHWSGLCEVCDAILEYTGECSRCYCELSFGTETWYCDNPKCPNYDPYRYGP